MTNEKWQELVDQATNNFQDVTVYTGDLVSEAQEGLIKHGTQDVLEFTNSEGTFRIIRENRPAIQHKQDDSDQKLGIDAGRSEYIFAGADISHKTRFFKLDDMDQWRELDQGPR